MNDTEKIINGLGEISVFFFEMYMKEIGGRVYKEYCDVAENAIALLKEQEPRVMTLSEIEQSEECIVWFEDDQFNKNTPYNHAVVDGIDQRNGWVWLRTIGNMGLQQRRDYENYGKRWRCWTKRPAEDQRKAAKWK